MSYVILFSLTIFCLFHLWLKKLRNYWTSRGFPSSELVFPFGSLKGIGTEKPWCDGLDEFYKKFKSQGPAVGLFYFIKPMLLLTDPELIKKVLVTNFESFHDRVIYYNKKDDPISAHLLALEGREWRERRVKLTPTFTSGKIKQMFGIIDMIGEKFVEVLENEVKMSTQIEIHDMLARFTTDNISNIAFGLDSNSLENSKSEFRTYGRKILDLDLLGFLKFFFTSSFPNLSRKLHLTANKKCVIDFFFNAFKANMEHREKNNIVRKDFLQILIDLRKTESLTVAELAAESFMFFFGGFETSSNLSTFTAYELALNPEVQTRLRNELRSGIEENDGKLSYDLISSFKYLEMVLNETLRKYPPAFVLVRHCKNDFRIPDTDLVIPANTDININVISLHRDPDYFPDPDKFDPERFSSENIRTNKPFTFLPFGDGPRKCIGGRFGMIQAKLAVAKLVLNFEISPCKDTTIPMKFSPPAILLAPINKMWLNLRKLS